MQLFPVFVMLNAIHVTETVRVCYSTAKTNYKFKSSRGEIKPRVILENKS